MAEWSNAVVLKTIEPKGSGGSNPSLSANFFSFFSWIYYFVHYILNNMNKVELEIISIFVRLADLLNLPKTVGEIYGLLFISEAPMCLDDLMNKLKISKGSTSQGLKILRSFGALKKIYIPGDRKDYYLAEDSLRKIANGFANEQIQPHLESGSERLEYILSLIHI